MLRAKKLNAADHIPADEILHRDRQERAAKWRHEFAEEIREARTRMTRDEIASDDAGIPIRGEI